MGIRHAELTQVGFFKFAITSISGATYCLHLKSLEQSIKKVQGGYILLQTVAS